MNTSNTMPLPRPRKQTIVVFLALIAAGMAGNYFAYELFFNVELIFGSIFAMLALQILSLRRGILAGAIISVITYALWNHPYAIVIMTAEVAVVGLLRKRRNMGIVIADALYWLFIGIPLVILFYYGVMHLPFSTAAVTMAKQALNGIANALAARLIFMAIEHKRNKIALSLRELIFSLLALFMLAPSLVLISLQSSADLERTERNARTALLLASQRTVPTIEAWLQSHLNTVEHLAWMSALQQLPFMQHAFDQMKKTDADFLRAGLLDGSATIIAYSPLIDEQGQTNIGKNFADRPFIPRLKQTLKPMLSEVVMGRIGTPKPMVTALAPVVKHGVYAGYVTGILDLEKVREMISLNMKGASLPEVQFVLLDRNGKVIVSSRQELKSLEPYQRSGGDLVEYGNGISRWTPYTVKNISVSNRWGKALYVTENRIGGLAEWTLILEQPLAPFQKQIFERYAAQLSWVFLLLLTALVIAEKSSRWVAQSLEEVKDISTDVPAKIASGAAIVWPESSIQETNALIENFRTMSQTLSHQFGTVRDLNADLEQRVEDRTRELKTILDTLTVGVSFIRDRKVQWANPAHDRIFGYSATETKSLDTSTFYADEEGFRRVGTEGYAQLLHGNSYTTEVEMKRQDGAHFWCSLTGRAVNPENLADGSIWMLQDITESKLTEQRITDAMNYAQTLLRTSPVGIITYQATGETVSANDAAARIVGTTIERMMQQNFRSLESWKRSGMFEMADRSLATGAEQRSDVHIVTSFGKSVDLDCLFIPFTFGTKPHLMLAAMDISDRKLAEKILYEKTVQLEDLTRNLEQRVAEEVALRRKNEDILVQQSKLASMGEMLGAIAHQWRQPLNALGLIIQNMKDAHAFGELNKEYIEQTVLKSMAQIQHMSATIDDFRNFFQPDKEKTEFDAMRAVGNVLSLFSAQLSANDIGYRLTCRTHGKVFEHEADIVPCPEKTVTGYRNEFEHVILNLINNARDAVLHRREQGYQGLGEIAFDFSCESGKVLIQVSDNGGGIPLQAQNRIFEPYFTTKDPNKGTGLGLYMSKVIIEDHMGGSIRAENGEQGAVFTLILAQAKKIG